MDVRIILPLRGDSGLINRSNAIAANKMLANGVRVYIYPKMSHVKGAVYDGWACLGSANFDALSLEVNRELNIATAHAPVVEELVQRVFLADMEKSAELTEPFPKKWPCTLGCFRTDHEITKAFGAMIAACRKANGFGAFVYLDHARAQSQGFAQRDTYDLRDFAERVVAIAQQGMPEVAAAAQNLLKAYDAARVHSINLGKFVPRSSGLSFYFPGSRSQMNRDIGTYEKLAFAKNSGWSEFLKEFR